MRTVTTIDAVRAWRRSVAGDVGFVPTMGYLHAGHAALCARARRENAALAASIFVNPTQFAPHEDLARYPRDLARDQELLAREGCDLLFAPDAAEVYPPGFATFVDVGPVAEPLEGARRPGHFRGVATVVLKLLSIVQPTRAYFGQKDAQQLAVIRRLVRDLDVPVEVVACPTVREPDGLALSSRNSYLSPAERAAAPVLHRALRAAEARWAAGEHDAEALRQAMRETLATEPLARPAYVSAADPLSLAELQQVGEAGALLSLAVQIGPACLIDNLVLART
jgi:pantoate--beta-alanine ligase